MVRVAKVTLSDTLVVSNKFGKLLLTDLLRMSEDINVRTTKFFGLQPVFSAGTVLVLILS